MTEALDMKIEQKLKSMPVLFSFIDNWKNVVHHVERRLDVGLIVEPEGLRLKTLEEDAVNVFEQIISEEHVIKKLKLKPWVEESDNLQVDCSFLSIYAAHDGRVKIVNIV